jgi:hypothetical protein
MGNQKNHSTPPRRRRAPLAGWLSLLTFVMLFGVLVMGAFIGFRGVFRMIWSALTGG